MKISRKENEKITFGSLEKGEVFIYDNCTYMKMNTVLSTNDSKIFVNAVNLANGDVRIFKKDTIIEIVKCELLIG